jgi:hypothetical protein
MIRKQVASMAKAVRCICGQFLSKQGNHDLYKCSRCKNQYEDRGFNTKLERIFLGDPDGTNYVAVDNRLQPIPNIPKEEKKMAFFSFDEKQAGGGFEALKAGEYEAVISKTEVKVSSGGNDMISVQLTIRNDVEQEYGGRKVFDNYVATEKAMFKFHQVAKALGWAQGEGADSLDEFAQKILFQPVRLKIGNPRNDPQRGEQTNIQNYLPATVDYAGGGGDPFADNGKPIDISDDDLPF